MKKQIIIISTALVVGILYSFSVNGKNQSNESTEKTPYDIALNCDDNIQSNFIIEVQPRFLNTITKEQVENATSVYDIIPKKDHHNYTYFDAVELTEFHENSMLRNHIRSSGKFFNAEQIDRLKKLDYSSNFSLTASIRKENLQGKVYSDTMIYYMSVVPYKPVSYRNGKKDLINYLRKYSLDVVQNTNTEKFDPGKVNFVVSSEGAIENVKLTYSCGFEFVDDRMVELIQNIPGEWEPGRNAKGEKVDQQLTLFFGQIGC